MIVIGIITGLILITMLVAMFSIGFQPFLMLLLLIPFFYLIGLYRVKRPGKGTIRRTARFLENKLFQVLLKDAVVIDTDIWMDNKYSSFFRAYSIVLAANNKKLSVFDRQHEEIIKHLQNPREENRHTRAPHEMQHPLQLFLNKNQIFIECMPSADDAADVNELLLIKALIAAAARSNNVVFIANNRQLIARARTVLKDKKIGFTIIDYLEELLPACAGYCTAVEKGIVKPRCWKRR